MKATYTWIGETREVFGRNRSKGEKLELTKDEAKSLVDQGLIKAAKSAKKEVSDG